MTSPHSQMRNVVYTLLARYNLNHIFEESREFHLRVENSPYMPLVIERNGDEISIAHYGEQNGDAMRDPEMTFRFPDWEPLTFENSYTGTYQRVYASVNGQERCDEALRKQLTSFAAIWARNIQTQGFADGPDIVVTSLTHQAVLEFALHPPEPAEDAHLEAEYESRFEQEDYEPSPYDGTYSEE